MTLSDHHRRWLTTLALAAFLGALTAWALQLREVTSALPEMLRAELQATRTQLLGEVDLLRADVRTEFGVSRSLLAGEVAATRSVAESRIVDLSLLADNRISSIERTLNAQLDQANAGIVAQVAGMRQDLGPVLASSARLLDTYQAVPERLAYANRWLWDCKEFSGCLQSQTLGLVGSARYTLGKVARASDEIPAMTQDFRGITGDVRRVADKWTAPVPLWKKIFGVVPTAARVAGEVW